MTSKSSMMQTKARTILGRRYKEEYTAFYKDELQVLPREDRKRYPLARGRALSRLVKLHFLEYQTIYQECHDVR